MQKLLPHAPDIEQAVLGALIRMGLGTGPENPYDKLNDIPHEEVFFNVKYRIIYRLMCGLRDQNLAIDIVTVGEEAERTGVADKIQSTRRDGGWRIFLIDLADSVFTAANYDSHLRLLIDSYIRRQAAIRANELYRMSVEGVATTEELAAQSSLIRELFTADESSDDYVGPGQFVEAFKSLGPVKKVLSGFHSLDRMLGEGFVAGTVSIIAGRTSSGKSTFRQNVTINLCRRGFGVLVLATEPPKRSEILRTLSVKTGISYDALNRMDEWSDDRERVQMVEQAALEVDSAWNLHTCYSKSLSSVAVGSWVRKVKSTHDLHVVFIDRFDLLKDVRSSFGSAEKSAVIKSAVQDLSILATQEDVHVCLVVQVKRGGGTGTANVRQYGRPTLDQIRESGGLEEGADLVLFVHRPGKDDPNVPDDQMEVFIGKQREGVAGASYCATLGFDGRTRKLSDLPDNENEE